MELQFKHLTESDIMQGLADAVNLKNIQLTQAGRELAEATRRIQTAQVIINQAGTAVFECYTELAEAMRENAELRAENERLRGIDALAGQEIRMPIKRTSDLAGHTITKYIRTDDELIFHLQSGDVVRYFHQQDCCEDVRIEDVIGDLNELLDSPLLLAEMVTSQDNQGQREYQPDSFTWTFYKFSTMRGDVTVRWYGESNGYYSESVEMEINGEIVVYSWEDENDGNQ